MICKACKTGADIKVNPDTPLSVLAFNAKKGWHAQCDGGDGGTWCDCQHRVGRKNVE